MQQIQDWFNSMDGVMQMFWLCAILSSVVFCVQIVLTMIGIDHDLDMDAGVDFDGNTTDFGGLSLFSIRSLVNFFVGFGWAGVSLNGLISNSIVLVVVCFFIGLAFGSLWFFIRKKMMRLETNGAYRIKDCVGQVCTVYLRIPAEGKGTGKVQISINGSIHEIAALTIGKELPTGTKVRVLELVDNETLKVEEV